MMMKTAYQEHVLSKMCTNGFLGLKTGQWSLKISSISIFQLLQPKIISAKSVISSVKIDPAQSTNSNTYLGCPQAQLNVDFNVVDLRIRKVAAHTVLSVRQFLA